MDSPSEVSLEKSMLADSAEAGSSLLNARSSPKKARGKGWRKTVLVWAISALVVFVINLTTALWSIGKYGIHGAQGRQTLYSGDCGSANKINSIIHLAINALSTVLLSGSNYCMQCLSAPTRSQVDRAHSKGIWLDIGVPSFRNLRRIDRKRVILWWLLGASSLPLHLFFNSTVFSSFSANKYWAIQVTEAFLNNGLADAGAESLVYDSVRNETVRLMGLYLNQQLEQLDNAACIAAYGTTIQTQRGSVLLVSDNNTAALIEGWEDSLPSYSDPISWMCNLAEATNTPCEYALAAARKDPASWSPFQPVTQIKYCLSERVPEKCTVQSSLPIVALILFLNLVKAGIMFNIALSVKESPLMTMGDAVSSFLRRPDEHTRDMCLTSRSDIQTSKSSWPRAAKLYDPKPRRLYASASTQRWVFCMLLYLSTFIAIFTLLGIGVSSLLRTYGGESNIVAHLGVGQVNPITMIAWGLPNTSNYMIQKVIIANLPQPILSFIYFSYNGLFTCMALSMEWNAYSLRRKGLRVSERPLGEQRSTYFLQLPYRIAVPMTMISSLLHWLVSQSIFVAIIEGYEYVDDYTGWAHADNLDEINCGYSPLAIILIIVVGVFMVAAILIAGSRRLETGMPVAASCSAAMAAACHPGLSHEDGEIASISTVQWGATGYDDADVGHCSFSSEDVSLVEGGMYYAGGKYLSQRKPQWRLAKME